MRSYDLLMPTTQTLDNCRYDIKEGLLRLNIVIDIQIKLLLVGLIIGKLWYIDIRLNRILDVVYSNWFDIEYGIIIYNKNYKVNNTYNSKIKLFLSEIL